MSHEKELDVVDEVAGLIAENERFRHELAEIDVERVHYRLALEEIAQRSTVERNPDGDDQAAHTMQLIAREALGENGRR